MLTSHFHEQKGGCRRRDAVYSYSLITRMIPFHKGSVVIHICRWCLKISLYSWDQFSHRILGEAVETWQQKLQNFLKLSIDIREMSLDSTALNPKHRHLSRHRYLHKFLFSLLNMSPTNPSRIQREISRPEVCNLLGVSGWKRAAWLEAGCCLWLGFSWCFPSSQIAANMLLTWLLPNCYRHPGFTGQIKSLGRPDLAYELQVFNLLYAEQFREESGCSRTTKS